MSFTITMKAAKEAEICLYDVIGGWDGVSAKDFRRDLKAAGDIDLIHLRINSPGGSVFDGLAIYNTLKSHKARVVTHVDGLAASMASVVAMAGDEIEMPANAFLMIHNPSDIAIGDAEDLRKTADLLDQVKAQLSEIYAGKSGKTADAVAKLMDEETWLDGQTAVDEGFATTLVGAMATAASIDKRHLTNFRNVPATLVAGPPPAISGAKPMADEAKPATLKELKAACPGADEKFLCAQLEAEATLAAAATSWMTAQQATIASLSEELKNAKTGGNKPGVTLPKPAGKKGKKKDEEEDEAGEETEDKVCDDDMEDMTPEEIKAQFEKAVAKRIKNQVALGRPGDRRGAIMAVANAEPALHQAYLVATNMSAKGRRLIAEKYDALPKPKKL
jgi:ATP-dependent Clp endopeptidase proteolytic subunit ClpP